MENAKQKYGRWCQGADVPGAATAADSWSVRFFAVFNVERCDALAMSVGGVNTAGTKLKSSSGWNDGGNGTDDYGFNVTPAGDRVAASFDHYGTRGNFWTHTEDPNDSSKAVNRFFESSSAEMKTWKSTKLDNAFYVRLVKD